MVEAARMTPTQALSRRFVMPGDLQELADGAEARTHVQRYGFRIGRYQLLHDLNLPVELGESPRCYPLPNSDIWFRGLTNLRGNLVPVFDLTSLLETESADSRRQMLLVIGSGDRSAGLIIDGTPMQISVDTTHQVEDPDDVPGLLREHVRAVYRFAGTLWLEVDFDGLFGSLARRTHEQ